MDRKKAVNSSSAPAAAGPYSQARWCGDLLYLSGQVGLDPATGKLAGHDVIKQVRQAMENLSAVLSEAKLGWEDVVKATIYLADMNDYGAVNESYAEHLKDCEIFPARVCVQVAALPLGARVEIEAIALR